MNSPILDRLAVRWNERNVGSLTIDRGGAMQFTYAEDWLNDPKAPPVSIQLPKLDAPHADRVCKPFFDGLLPEETQRIAAARALGISPQNPFRLLAALGGDTAGALTFWRQEGAADTDSSVFPIMQSDTEVQSLIDRMADVPMLAGEAHARYSLAGAQSKLPVRLMDGRIALAGDGEPTTHIIKPEPDRFPKLAANEAFCLNLAAAVGLDTAGARWRMVGGRPCLLVRRFDRHMDGGQILRLHQEDFAQALGVLSSRKYASDGGPVFRDCFALVRRVATSPDRDALKLLDAALFNLIIGNADAHAKNYSLLRQADGDVVLAPLYDLVATIAWPELSSRFSMSFGRARTLEGLTGACFDRFAQDAGFDPDMVRARALSLSERIGEVITAGLTVPGLDDMARIACLAELVLDRADRLRLKIEAGFG